MYCLNRVCPLLEELFQEKSETTSSESRLGSLLVLNDSKSQALFFQVLPHCGTSSTVWYPPPIALHLILLLWGVYVWAYLPQQEYKVRGQLCGISFYFYVDFRTNMRLLGLYNKSYYLRSHLTSPLYVMFLDSISPFSFCLFELGSYCSPVGLELAV